MRRGKELNCRITDPDKWGYRTACDGSTHWTEQQKPTKKGEQAEMFYEVGQRWMSDICPQYYLRRAREVEEILNKASTLLKTTPDQLQTKVNKLVDNVASLEVQLTELKAAEVKTNE